jgi:hypothetical protein
MMRIAKDFISKDFISKKILAALLCVLISLLFVSPAQAVRDTDGDGIRNGLDKCPKQPGPASNRGCPILISADGDTDGIADTEDNCPNVFNPAQYDVTYDGVGDACEERAQFGLSPSNTATQNRQALYNALSGSNEVVLGPGDYTVENDPALGFIVLEDFSGSLTMHEGARFVFTNTRGRGFELHSGEGAKFYNLSATFTTLPPERVGSQELFYFERTTDTLIKDADINGSAAAGLVFGGGIRPVVDGGLIRNTRADGVHFANTRDARAVGVTTDTTGDDGIAFVSYGGGAQGIGGYVSNITVKKSEARGIAVVGSAQVLIENFRIEDVRTSGILVAQEDFYNTPVPYNVTARNGTIINPGQYPGHGHPHGHGISLFEIGEGVSFSDITITNPSVSCTGGDGMYYPASFTGITCN